MKDFLAPVFALFVVSQLTACGSGGSDSSAGVTPSKTIVQPTTDATQIEQPQENENVTDVDLSQDEEEEVSNPFEIDETPADLAEPELPPQESGGIVDVDLSKEEEEEARNPYVVDDVPATLVETAVPQPAQFSLGSEITAIDSSMTAWMLNDLMKTAGVKDVNTASNSHSWIYTKQGVWFTTSLEDVVVDEQGWPTSMTLRDGSIADSFRTSVMTSKVRDAYEAGVYTLTFQGQGNINVTNATVLEQSDNQLLLDYYGDGEITIEITDTDPLGTDNYIRNITLRRPSAVEGETFNKAYLDYLKPSKVIRPTKLVGNALLYAYPNANGEQAALTGQAAWAKRTQLNDAKWSGDHGAPYEVIAELANKSESHLWLNIPLAADDEYVQALATLMLNNLSANRAIYLELGDEINKMTYPNILGRDYALNQAKARWPNVVIGETTAYSDARITEDMLVLNWQAARTLEVAAIFKSVWGKQQNRIAVVLGGNSRYARDAEAYYSALLTAPVYVNEEDAGLPALAIDALAMDVQLTNTSATAFDDGNSDTFIAEAIDYINGSGRFGDDSEAPGLRYTVRQVSEISQSYGLPVIAYAGGHNLSAATATNYRVLKNTAMYDIYQVLFDMWREENGGLFINAHGISGVGIPSSCQQSYYVLASAVNSLGVKETQMQNEADAPVYRATMDMMRALGQTK
ncbi:hypothetical protein CA267_003595 [Alteromonas pelagimontana]|uniref:Uncharacterized protein n=1 Tax=Alteromonas pelagimontana TaxID=1858656 RepID=A0A6M4M9U8_9ALTE|nr:hypothetical protein [Alteromonas pelagimontana]QJR79933.1 hypothetical protein CA267_003595 [Alteromonas pelagimontana]